MDSSLISILIYFGGFVMIALFISIIKTNKKQQTSTIISQKSISNGQITQFQHSKPVLQQAKIIDIPLPVTSTQEPVVKSLQHKEYQEINPTATSPNISQINEAFFILGDFDIKSAIIYSEILKRADY